MIETIKGNFFSYLFSQPEYMLQLYQVMHPEDTEAREEDFKQIIAQGNSLAVERCRRREGAAGADGR